MAKTVIQDTNDTQGKLFDPAPSASTFNPNELHDSEADEAMRNGNMLYLGHCCLHFLKRNGLELQYKLWLVHVKHAAPAYKLIATENEWLWAWESLRQSKSVQKKFGKLRAAKARWKSPRDRFVCLPAGVEFVVAIKQTELENLRSRGWSNDFTPRVSVMTTAPLSLRPGKADRLECCDAACEVTIQIEKSLGKEREADVMRVTLEDIVSLSDTCVRVKAKSLNQAYSIASRRLEPERRGHGGRTYDRFLYVDREARRAILLEEIRLKLETESWEVPKPKCENQPSSRVGG